MTDYHRTLFLTGVQGQYKIWKKDLAPACNKADSVVQFGNLIGCNDFVKDRENFGANEAVLKYVMLYRSTQEKWTQLVGANEMAALNLPKEWTNATSRKILRDSWLGENPTMKIAASDKGRLMTHAGLTYGEWLAIGSPDTAEEAAARLNEKYMRTIYQGPCYRLGDSPNFAANPIWADTAMELYSSWITAPVAMPFDQIHGSGNLSSEEHRGLLSDKTSILSHVDEVRFQKFGSMVRIKGMQFTSIEIMLPEEVVNTIPRPKSVYIERFETPNFDDL